MANFLEKPAVEKKREADSKDDPKTNLYDITKSAKGGFDVSMPGLVNQDENYIMGRSSVHFSSYEEAQEAVAQSKNQNHEKKEGKTEKLAEHDLSMLAQRIGLSSSEMHKGVLIRQFAASQKITPETALKELRFYVKNKIRDNEAGPIYHYHRTGLDQYKNIVGKGALLSRIKLLKENPKVNLPAWSANENIMMTRDRLDRNGNLISPGIKKNEVIGAAGSAIVFVFKDNIMDTEDYDATGMFPTVSEISMLNSCEAVLVNNAGDIDAVRKELENNNLGNIKVEQKSKWMENNSAVNRS